VTLDDVRRFQHRSSSTVWLHPRSEPPGALEALQAALEALFPQCSDQSSISASGFTPHLSIGQVDHNDDAEARMAEWRRILPISFPVRSIHLISRRDDEAFVIRYAIPLGEAQQ
jgi:2'-5' RNA ligase